MLKSSGKHSTIICFSFTDGTNGFGYDKNPVFDSSYYRTLYGAILGYINGFYVSADFMSLN